MARSVQSSGFGGFALRNRSSECYIENGLYKTYGGAVRCLRDSATTTWTYSWNVPAGHSADTATVTVAGDDIAGNAYAGSDSIIYTIDNTAPTISSGTLASNNDYMDIAINEAVYNTSGGSGALEVSDFALTFTQNGGNASAANISTITKTDSNPLVGGETTIRANLSITGTPSGAETVDIKPVATSIYDIVGNAMAGTETTGAKTLNDQLAPTIDSAIDDTDGYINVDETSSGINILITTTGVEDGQTVTCNIKDVGDTHTVGPVTGDITSNAVTIASTTLTSLDDGTITVSCDVSDISGNPATQGTDTSVKDVVVPSNIGISSITTDSSTQITVTSQAATDAGVGLHSTPYWFNETTANPGATDSTVYQTATTFIDTGLAVNTQYTYQVKAKDAVGNESAYSSTLSKYTLSNIPTSLTLTSDSISQITASWNANSNPASTEYYIENITTANNSGWTTDTSWISSSLSCGTSYSFKVKTRNGDSVETAFTNIISVETNRCGGGFISPAPPIITLPQGQTPVFEITRITENENVINLSNVKNAYQMAISTTPDFEYVSWKLYEENITIPDTTKLYIKFRSKTGGISEVIEVEVNKDPESKEIPEGSLVIVEGDYKVYIKKQNYFRHIPNLTIFSFYSHFKWNKIKTITITKEQFNNYQLSILVRELNDTKVYQINDNNLTKHHLNITATQFTNSNRSWDMIYIINKRERDYYEVGEDVVK